MTQGEVIALIKAFGGSSGGGGGGGSAVLVVSADNTYTLDKTWAEINNSVSAVMQINGTVYYLANVLSDPNYEVQFISFAPYDGDIAVSSFVADSENDYPVYDDR